MALAERRLNGNNSAMPKPDESRPSFVPRNWPGWLVVAFLWLAARLPQRLGNGLAVPLGKLMYWLMGSRRRVAARNIERCFPELDEAAQQALLKDNFTALARTVFETAWSWSPSAWMDRSGQLEGADNLLRAREGGRGVLFLTLHSTCLEIGARYMGVQLMRLGIESAGIYRPLRNPVLEWYQNRGRARYANGMISKRDLRSAIRLLRKGGVIWYAPDQDFGPKESMFAPFFGIQAASLLATRKLVQLTDCAVVPMYPVFDAERNFYHSQLLPALENFPGEDELADLTRINRITEDLIRTAPEQYWWVHRRFKTRPPGDAPFY
jgi:KDO2-lipid IV(A) lauroyltransferase